MQFLICIALLLNTVCASNKTIIKLDDSYSSNIEHKKNIEIKFKSEQNMPFMLTIYTSDGKPLIFKGSSFKYTGKITYYELENLGIKPNHIVMTTSSPEIDFTKVISSFLAVCSLLVITFFKRDSKISQLFLVILICIELYRASDYTKIGDRIVHKTLF